MRNRFFFFMVLFFLFPFVTFVRAQQKSERWVCLKAERAEAGHTAAVTVDPEARLLPNSETFVFECLSNADCTSGNSQVDQSVFGKNSLQEMAEKYNYNFQGTTLASNPTTSNGAGELPSFTWKSASKPHERRWLALNYFEPTPETGTGEDPTQQLGTFSFDAAINQSDCVGLNWDPYGRVFDADTLEPVSGASVTLLIKRDNGSFTLMTPNDLLGGNITNPQKTEDDGGFSFVVPDGTYKLSVSHQLYTFPEQVFDIHSNYSKIYSDIYPDQTGEEIVQQGKIQHRDIPLGPKSTSQSNESKLMEYFYKLNKGVLTLNIKGRVSHPFSLIKAYSLKPDPILGENARYRLLTEEPIRADAMGSFSLTIDQSGFEPDESFGDITVEKVDLTEPANLAEKIKKWISNFGLVSAQTKLVSNFRFDPIPNYLEGYAYDSRGEAIPDATVSIILNFSNKPSYQTKADKNGYFSIGSEFLPSMPYRISFKSSSGQTVEVTTSRFIVQNQNTISQSKVNINKFKNAKGEVILPPEKEITKTTSKAKDIRLITKDNFIPLVFTLLLILVFAAVLIVYYFRKRVV